MSPWPVKVLFRRKEITDAGFPALQGGGQREFILLGQNTWPLVFRIDDDRPSFWIDNANGQHSRRKIFIRLVGEFRQALRGRKNFKHHLGCGRRESNSLVLFGEPMFGEKHHVWSAHGIGRSSRDHAGFDKHFPKPIVLHKVAQLTQNPRLDLAMAESGW